MVSMASHSASVHGSVMNSAAGKVGTKWQGELRLHDRWASWRGAVGDGVLHRHFAAQAIIADRPIRVRDAQDHLIEATCILIDPLTPHRIEPGGEALLVYVEPGRSVDPEFEQLLRSMVARTSPALVERHGGARFWTSWRTSALTAVGPIDRRLTAALDYIEGALLSGPVPLHHAAATASLSPDRFRHLFADQLGVPYKRYVLWRRLRLAAVELAAGRDVTTAAHAAGFSDSAHLARTIKTTFGVTAGQALLPA